MLWRTLRIVGLCGVLTAVVAPACGGSSSSPPSGGGSAAGGSAGTAAKPSTTAGASGNPPVSCGTASCEGVSFQSFVIPACCADSKTDHCGLDSTVLSMADPTFADACQPRDQPGTLDANCPDSPETPVAGTGLAIAFKGCCRPNRTCGYMLDKILGIVPLGLGCVDSAPAVMLASVARVAVLVWAVPAATVRAAPRTSRLGVPRDNPAAAPQVTRPAALPAAHSPGLPDVFCGGGALTASVLGAP